MKTFAAPRQDFAPPEPVNFVAPKFTILPPKLPGKELQDGKKDRLRSQTMEVRILPAFTEQGIELPAIDPEQALQYADLGYKADVLGDWVVKMRASYVKHYSKSQAREYYSWLPGDCIIENGGDEPDIVQSPVGVCSWKWFKALAGYRERRRVMYANKMPGAEMNKTLAEEYDPKSVLAVNSVSPSGYGYFMQVIPLQMGSTKYDVDSLGVCLLPIFGPGMTKSFEQYLAIRSDRFSETDPISLETMGIEGDVVSFKNGRTLKISRASTEHVFTAGVTYPLPDGWAKAWTPWEKVLTFSRPGDLIEPLIRVTSPAAVDWALTGTEWECLIPEKHRGCGSDFSLDPKAGVSVQVDEYGTNQEHDSEENNLPFKEDRTLPPTPPVPQHAPGEVRNISIPSGNGIELNLSDESRAAYERAVSTVTRAHEKGVKGEK